MFGCRFKVKRFFFRLSMQNIYFLYENYLDSFLDIKELTRKIQIYIIRFGDYPLIQIVMCRPMRYKEREQIALLPFQYPEPGSNRHGSESTGV